MSVNVQAFLDPPDVQAHVDWPDDVAVLVGAGAVVAGPPGPPGKVTAITLAAVTALAVAGTLVDGLIYNVTDAGFLAVPLTASTYRRFYAIHVGPTAPDDPFAIWFDTSGI